MTINDFNMQSMALNKKFAVPLVILLLAIVAGGGWFLWQNTQGGKAAGGIKQLYTCSMHPFIVKEKPGVCPICGMELIKKIDSAAKGVAQRADEEQLTGASKRVSLSQTQRVMANVTTVEAKEETLSKEINAGGIVQYNQSRQAKVTAWVAGRLEKLNVNSVGAMVSKEKPVAEIYSPDLVATEQEYLLAIKSREELKSSPIGSISRNGDELVASAKQRLMLFGVKEGQIAELERSGKPNIRISIYSPFSGVVIEKMVQQGQYVNTGEVLFNIADLSTVWVEVEVYENEVSSIHIGQQVEVRSQSFPDKPSTGRIAFIYPFLDPKTRTVKARIELANPGMKLKPEMFVNTIIKVALTPTIAVPATAVMNTGKRQVVWVESSPGVFESRTVQVGQQAEDKVQILSGLRSGEKVAASGGYLIDSESQLK
ncbi:MAG: efflux RND transporter periplasmic adaptor subunit [Chlorobiaceae bacterium]